MAHIRIQDRDVHASSCAWIDTRIYLYIYIYILAHISIYIYIYIISPKERDMHAYTENKFISIKFNILNSNKLNPKVDSIYIHMHVRALSRSDHLTFDTFLRTMYACSAFSRSTAKQATI